ncbi:MAG: hypothetical protein LBS21_07970 [Clostridiales bacterium]|jgi:uncharacterized protein with FMN-binding domain|nr:hypothetical protein [Clostridiales bacterium]
MGGTKIMVFHLREIIRTLLFAIAGIAIIIALVYLFIPKDKSEGEESAAAYIPGTYISQITLSDQPVNIEVTVDKNSILSVELKNMAEVQEVFYPLVKPAIERIAAEIVQTQSLDVHISAEDSVTSGVLLSAIEEALTKARVTED